MNLVDETFAALGAALRGLARFVTPLAATIFPWLYDLVTTLIIALHGTAQQLATALFALRDWAVTELAKVRALIKDVQASLDALAASIPQLFSVLAERARQYILARLRVNPLGVLSEPFRIMHDAGGALNLGDQSGAAPWSVLGGLHAELRLSRLDPTHPVKVVLDEFRADRAAYRQGTPPAVPAPAATPAGLPGIDALEDPRGADPNAAGLLTADDLRYAQQTTRGQTA